MLPIFSLYSGYWRKTLNNIGGCKGSSTLSREMDLPFFTGYLSRLIRVRTGSYSSSAGSSSHCSVSCRRSAGCHSPFAGSHSYYASCCSPFIWRYSQVATKGRDISKYPCNGRLLVTSNGCPLNVVMHCLLWPERCLSLAFSSFLAVDHDSIF